MTVTIFTDPRTSAKRYFADGKRVSSRTAMQLMERDDVTIILK